MSNEEIVTVTNIAGTFYFCFRLLAKLPTHNCLLLRYVFCLLHYINKHSEVNRMDAYNLAICIGPNMLWPNKPPLDALQKEVTAKVNKYTLHAVNLSR